MTSVLLLSQHTAYRAGSSEQLTQSLKAIVLLSHSLCLCGFHLLLLCSAVGASSRWWAPWSQKSHDGQKHPVHAWSMNDSLHPTRHLFLPSVMKRQWDKAEGLLVLEIDQWIQLSRQLNGSQLANIWVMHLTSWSIAFLICPIKINAEVNYINMCRNTISMPERLQTYRR